jgi:hypothetical protein
MRAVVFSRIPPPHLSLSTAIAQLRLRRLAGAYVVRSGRRFLRRPAIPLPPNFPRRLPAFVEIIQLLLVLECIHRSKKAVVFIGGQLLISDQSLKGFYNKFVSGLHVSEDIPLQDEKTRVDAHPRLRHLLDASYEASRIGLGNMVTQVRLHAYKSGNLVPLPGKVELAQKIEVRQAVGIICQEYFFVCKYISQRPATAVLCLNEVQYQ